MDDISTSFCFICLLHLANERGLKIEVGDTGEDAPIVEEGDNKVGDIWGLKVCHSLFLWSTLLTTKMFSRYSGIRMRLLGHKGISDLCFVCFALLHIYGTLYIVYQ